MAGHWAEQTAEPKAEKRVELRAVTKAAPLAHQSAVTTAAYLADL